MKSYNHRINWNLDDRDDRCNLETDPCERIYRARRGSEWHKRMMYQPNAYSRAMSSNVEQCRASWRNMKKQCDNIELNLEWRTMVPVSLLPGNHIAIPKGFPELPYRRLRNPFSHFQHPRCTHVYSWFLMHFFWQSLLVLIFLHDKETWRWWNMPVSLDLDHQHSAVADWDDQLHPAESIRWGSPTHVSSSQCNCKLLPNKGRQSIKYIYIYYIYIYILYMYV